MEVFTLGNLPNVGDGDALTMLRRSLEIARLQAGRPTYRKMSSICGLSASTICRIFKATKPPAWDNLVGVLLALSIDADADTKWRELWLNAENATSPIPVELEDGLVIPGRQHCPTCGTWIADAKTHSAHHTHLDQLAQSITELQWQIATLAATTRRDRPGQNPAPPQTPGPCDNPNRPPTTTPLRRRLPEPRP